MIKESILKLISYLLIWILAIGFYSFLREYGHQIKSGYSSISTYEQIKLILVLGIIAGILFGSLQLTFEKIIFNHVSFSIVILLGSVGYFVAILLLFTLTIFFFSIFLNSPSTTTIYRDILFSDKLIPLGAYCFVVATLINFYAEMEKKFGSSNLRKILTGKFYEPKVEYRIFMFLDLRASTRIAEELGHIKYSSLIQDCFRDLAIVEKYNAEIYQYVGDEAVLTWEKYKGLKNNNCIQSFFAFQNKIQIKSKYYIEKYGIIPEFKAGIHIGSITVAEVGEVKREIAYHGDTINTASRIQGECNALGRNFLISEELHSKLLIQDNNHQFYFEGDIQLKGKSKTVKIFSLTERI